MNAQGWGIPDDGVVSDATEGSAVGNPDDGGIAAEAADYNHLLLLGPADPGYFSTPSQMPGAVIEPLYITDPFEGSIALSSQGQAVIAEGSPRPSSTISPRHRRSRRAPPRRDDRRRRRRKRRSRRRCPPGRDAVSDRSITWQGAQVSCGDGGEAA